MTVQSSADAALEEQIRQISDLPLEQRSEAIRQAEQALRSLLEGDA